MVDVNKKEEVGKQEVPAPEQKPHFEGEKSEAKPESSEAETAELNSIKELLEREVHIMNADPDLKKVAQTEAKEIASFGAEELIVRFEEIASKKGLVAAFSVAQKTNNAFIMDRFHDFMIKDGRYKKFPL